MASSRIKGITIEIGGDTTGLQKALSGVDKSLKTTNASLRDVNKLLKIDPTNVDLLRQKQGYLASAIKDVKEKLEIEQEALRQLKSADTTEDTTEKQKALEREIIDVQQELKKYQDELDDTEAALKGTARETEDAANATNKMERETEEAEDAQSRANQGWTAARQVLADLATRGIQLAIEAIKKLAQEMVEAVNDATDFADEILTLSSQTGLATDTLQEFRYMQGLVDVSMDTLSSSLRRLTNNMQNTANGTGEAYGAFEALGISVTDSNGHLRNAEEVFYDVIDALGEMENETERDAYSMDIFGRSAQDLNPMIEAGADAIEAFAEEAHDMGYVLDSETLESLGAVDDSFERIQNQMEAVRNQIVAEMAPAIEEIADAFLEWSQTVDWTEVADTIGEVLDVVMDIASFVLDHKEVVVAALVALGGAIAGVTTAQWALNVAMTANPIGLIIAAVGGLSAAMLVFEERTGHISWSWQVTIEAFMDSVERAKEFFIRAIRQILQAVAFMANNIRTVYEFFRDIIQKIRDFFVSRFADSYDVVTGKWSGIIGFFQTLYDNVTRIWSGITGFFQNLNIQLPHIKVPHFNITGGFSISPPSVPRMSVDWYDKGGIFTNPAIIGVGEKRPEFVGALDDLRKIVAEESRNNVSITVNAAPGQSETAIADMVMRKMQQAVNRKGAVYA